MAYITGEHCNHGGSCDCCGGIFDYQKLVKGQSFFGERKRLVFKCI